jgi:hypothetical protein
MKWFLQKISPQNFHYSMLWGLDIWEFSINSIIIICRMTEIHVKGGGNTFVLHFSCVWFLTSVYCAVSEFWLHIDHHDWRYLFVSLQRVSILGTCFGDWCMIWTYVSQTGQATDDNKRMRIACSITKATDTLSQYVILNAFPLHQWLNEGASVLYYTYIACFVCL